MQRPRIHHNKSLVSPAFHNYGLGEPLISHAGPCHRVPQPLTLERNKNISVWLQELDNIRFLYVFLSRSVATIAKQFQVLTSVYCLMFVNNIFENINFSSEMILCRQWMDRRRFSRLFLILSAHILKIRVHWISGATFYCRFSHTRLKLKRFGRMPKIYSFLKLNQQNNTWKYFEF